MNESIKLQKEDELKDEPREGQKNPEISGEDNNTPESDIKTATVFGRECFIMEDPGLEDGGKGKIAIVYWPGLSGTRSEKELRNMTDEICKNLGVGRVVFSDKNLIKKDCPASPQEVLEHAGSLSPESFRSTILRIVLRTRKAVAAFVTLKFAGPAIAGMVLALSPGCDIGTEPKDNKPKTGLSMNGDSTNGDGGEPPKFGIKESALTFDGLSDLEGNQQCADWSETGDVSPGAPAVIEGKHVLPLVRNGQLYYVEGNNIKEVLPDEGTLPQPTVTPMEIDFSPEPEPTGVPLIAGFYELGGIDYLTFVQDNKIWKGEVSHGGVGGTLKIDNIENVYENSNFSSAKEAMIRVEGGVPYLYIHANNWVIQMNMETGDTPNTYQNDNDPCKGLPHTEENGSGYFVGVREHSDGRCVIVKDNDEGQFYNGGQEMLGSFSTTYEYQNARAAVNNIVYTMDDGSGYRICFAFGNEPICGDNEVNQGWEVCDGTAFPAGVDCQSEGYDSGILGCEGDCLSLDTSNCEYDCGDNELDPGELCDGTDLPAGASCETEGFDFGTLGCSGDCQSFDTSGCEYECGDNEIDPGELCDGTAIPVGSDCETEGFDFGTLGCFGDCQSFDTSGCEYECGDNEIDPGELCDGTAIPVGSDCETEGFD
ncbi:hypothetical protein GF366_03805, partial [Candidatus Peregrinibacteria bacterium]|nr:hypothetical protein [Candidatus Peregrinibacteria bacterium]